MRPIRITAHLSPTATADAWVPIHLDSLVAAGTLRGSPVTVDTPVSEIRWRRIPGVVHLQHAGERCFACSAGRVCADGSTVQWLAYGARRAFRKALKRLWRPGEPIALEPGPKHRIERWEVEEADHDLVDVFALEGKASRILPQGWVATAGEWTEGAHEPPYWHPGRQHPTPELGSPVELHAAALAMLLEEDLRWTQDTIERTRSDTDFIAVARSRLARLQERSDGP